METSIVDTQDDIPLLSAFSKSAMSCPICGEACRCAESRTRERKQIVLADVDEYEDTEEQFASSVTGVQREEEEQELASGSLAAARERYACSLTISAQRETTSNTSMSEADSWRDEVASRLESYKARRRRGLSDESLSFNFESTTANHVFLRPEKPLEPEAEPAQNGPELLSPYYANSLATAPAYHEPINPLESMDHTSPEVQDSFPEFEQPPAEPKAAPETAKLIVFPRAPLPQEPPRDQLAEPVFDKPRIVEAAETMETIAVPLADITLRPEDADESYLSYTEPDRELPYRVAGKSQRTFGELVDVLLVIIATGIFATVLSKMDPLLFAQDKKTTLALATLVPATFWAIYKYLFLVFQGATVGMQLARLRLIDLDGNYPDRNRRRFRAVAMLVSSFPLGLGVMWSFVDQDELCWHDRISRTYLTSK